jgi:3-hydroxyisobutyrate dehydrogenase-like beta-hydroxyacid dehydrogenase
MNIAFIGLGNMGSPMATNLIKAGHTLSVYNRTRARADALKHLGARIATTPGEAAAGAEVAITMLADDHALESVVFEKGKGILDALPPNAIHI